jgi:hypothetical protein
LDRECEIIYCQVRCEVGLVDRHAGSSQLWSRGLPRRWRDRPSRRPTAPGTVAPSSRNQHSQATSRGRQTSEANRVVQKKTERLHAAIRSVLQRTVRTEPSGHSAAETALSRREIKESTQKQRQEAAGIDTKQRPRGKLLCKSSKENSYCFAHVSSLATIKS